MELPEPPKSLVRSARMKSLGILLLGITGVITSITGAVAVDILTNFHDESQCIRELSNETSRLEGEIDTRGWKALLGVYGGDPKAKTAENARELTILTEQWQVAQDRRNHAEEIC